MKSNKFAKVVTHPKYKSGIWDYDVAMIKVNFEIQGANNFPVDFAFPVSRNSVAGRKSRENRRICFPNLLARSRGGVSRFYQMHSENSFPSLDVVMHEPIHGAFYLQHRLAGLERLGKDLRISFFTWRQHCNQKATARLGGEYIHFFSFVNMKKIFFLS